jgi:4-amino-4-deoxy-L-arabinose transferase-like glycosyltransferase
MRARALDTLWLLLLGLYILAGTGLASFHGDEAMQISTSQDYRTTFIDGQPGQLTVAPPYAVDTPPWLRLINGSINRYAIGLSWQVSGLGGTPLPGIWEWPLSYEANVARGHRPDDAALLAARLPSALFLALSAAVMFSIGQQMGGRPLAYLASGLYAANPVLLLNGRRAMMEGSMLFFGLLVVLAAVVIAKRRATSHPLTPSPTGGEGEKDTRAAKAIWWLVLALAGGLALASKHSGIVFVAGAFGWVWLAEVRPVFRSAGWLPNSIRTTLKLAACFAGSVAVFIALSPALWIHPIARLGDLLVERQALLDSQVKAYGAATTFPERVEGILLQPFMVPAQHFEAAFWANAAPVMAEVERYNASPLSGIQFGALAGGALTLLSFVGLALSARDGWRCGLLAWWAVNVAVLLVNPLPWQRYYLPLIPVSILLAGYGALALLRLIRQPKSLLAIQPK